MRILLIGREVRERRDIRDYGGIWSYYLARELRRRGVDIRFSNMIRKGRLSSDLVQNFNLAGIDHVLALGHRLFSKSSPVCARIMRRTLRGAVTQLNDTPVAFTRDIDCTFSVRDPCGAMGNHHVGWAVDGDICQPAQVPGELRILVDHPDYVDERGDRTGAVLADVLAFARSRAWAPRFSWVRVRQIGDGGAYDADFAVKPFGRGHVSFEEMCREYSATHLFLPTHRESVGLTVLETALAGALPVVPARFVSCDLLKTVRHVSYADAIDWPVVLDMIDINASRATAMQNSWVKVGQRMMHWLTRY